MVAILGLSQRSFPTVGVLSLEDVTTLITPAGIPASSASWVNEKSKKSNRNNILGKTG